MPQVGCNPNAGRDTGERKQKSNLEPAKKVLEIQWTKKKDAGRKQEPEAGVFPTTAQCQLPDIEKADQSEEPTHKQLRPDLPMRQPSKSEKNQSRKKNSMFVV